MNIFGETLPASPIAPSRRRVLYGPTFADVGFNPSNKPWYAARFNALASRCTVDTARDFVPASAPILSTANHDDFTCGESPFLVSSTYFQDVRIGIAIGKRDVGSNREWEIASSTGPTPHFESYNGTTSMFVNVIHNLNHTLSQWVTTTGLYDPITGRGWLNWNDKPWVYANKTGTLGTNTQDFTIGNVTGGGASWDGAIGPCFLSKYVPGGMTAACSSIHDHRYNSGNGILSDDLQSQEIFQRLATQYDLSSSQYHEGNDTDITFGDIDWCLTCWVTLRQNTSCTIIGKRQLSAEKEAELFYSSSSAKFGIEVYDGSTTSACTISQSGTVSTPSKHFVMIGHDAANSKCFISVDGGAFAENADTIAPGIGGATFTLGAMEGGLSPASVDLEQVAIFKPSDVDSVRTAIRDAMYNSGSGLAVENVSDANKTAWGASNAFPMFDGDNTRVRDVWGSADPLTANNSPIVSPGHVDQPKRCAAHFPGTDEFLSVADAASLSAGDVDFAISVWFKARTSGSSMIIAGKGDSATSNSMEWFLEWQATDRVRFVVGSGSSNAQVEWATVLNTNQWYHALVWHDSDNDTINIRIDDGAATSTAFADGSQDTAEELTIGSHPKTHSNYWHGEIGPFAFMKPPTAIADLIANVHTTFWNDGDGVNPEDVSASDQSDFGAQSAWKLDEGKDSRADSWGLNTLTQNNGVIGGFGHVKVGTSLGTFNNLPQKTSFDLDAASGNEVSKFGTSHTLTESGTVGARDGLPTSQPDVTGDAIAAVADRHGLALTLLQSDFDKRPLWQATGVNGKPTFLFDGLDDFLRIVDDLGLSSLTKASVFFVANLGFDQNETVFSFDNYEFAYDSRNSTDDARIYATNGSTYNQFDGAGTGWNVFGIVFDGTQATNADRIKYYLNKTELTLDLTSGTLPAALTAFTQLTIGDSDAGGVPLNGQLADILFANDALTESQRNWVFNGLMKEYGL